VIGEEGVRFESEGGGGYFYARTGRWEGEGERKEMVIGR
jgi:hypothetical protein